MTRPRILGSECSCSVVLAAAMNEMLAAPIGTSRTASTGSVGAIAAAVTKMPNAPAEKISHRLVGRGRAALKRAPTRAPDAIIDVRKPKVAAPRSKVKRASSGRTTEKFSPNVATTATSATVPRSRGVLQTYLRPARTWPGSRATTAPRWSRAGSMARRARITAPKVPAFTKKAHGRPTVAIATPASAGPMILLALNTALLRLTAFGTRSRPTISVTKD